MEGSHNEKKKVKDTQVKTVPVPFELKEIKENIIISSNSFTKLSKEEILSQALKFHSEGKNFEATKYYQHLIDQGLNDHRIFANHGTVLQNIGKVEEAEISTRKAIELNPNFTNAHFNLGIILKNIGKVEEAEVSTRKAIELNPNFAEAHSNLGLILNDLGKLKEAEVSTRKAIELNPNFAIAHYNLGLILKDLGDLQKAEISERKAIELNPNHAKAHSILSNILKDLGKRKEAIIHSKKAVELKPEDDKLVKSLAYDLCNEKKYELALKYLKKNKSNSCESLYLGCLLSLDKEKEFNHKYKELSFKNICNAEVGGIIEHASILYGKEYKSTFCNETMNYISIEKINENSLSETHLNELIEYCKTCNKENREQALLTNGIQTSGNLFSLDYPFIQEMKKALQEKIEKYKQKFKYSSQGFIENWPEIYELRSWMISMKNGGFLKSHNHEYGWITGSFYLQIPKYLDNNNDSGNIAFSYEGPRYPNKEKNFHLTIKKVETRDICIFPSSLFHYTIPFRSKEERICFVFDLVQK